MMPRSKPKETIVHRIELGSWERTRLEGMADAYNFNKIATPTVAGLSDVSFVLLLGGLLAAWKVIDKDTWDALSNGITEVPEAIQALMDSLNAALEEARQLKEDITSFPGDVRSEFQRQMARIFGRNTGPIDPERAAAMRDIYTSQPTGPPPSSPADVWRTYGQG
jgi:hypothetical protein